MGGLSSLVFDSKTHTFFALSDDKKNHRIYEFSLSSEQPYQLLLKSQILLHTSKSSKLPFPMDPEALALGPQDSFYLASEGQQIFKVPSPPQIFEFNLQGLLKDSWPTPLVFWDKNQVSKFGTQENKGFESLTFSSQFKTLWTATESPLIQDLKPWIRLSEFEKTSKKLITQYPYPLTNSSGLTEMIYLKNKTFLTLERSYDSQKKTESTFLFLSSCQKASNVVDQISLQKFTPCSKKLLWSSEKEKSTSIDNLEGMALGPYRDSQSQLLVLVADNNFNSEQKNQILFLELKKRD